MHHPSRPLAVALAVAAVGVLLTACAASPPPAAPTVQTFEVPDSAVAATVTTPDTWDRAGQDAPLVVRSTTPSGDPGFTANVVVTTSDPGTATLEDRTAEAAEALQTSADVTLDPTQPGPVTVAGLPAYRLGATRTVDDVPVTQVETVVEVATPAGSAFVYVTETYATGDAEGAAQARAVTDSLVVTPAG
ncbi:hypothetical protein [Oerskovia sp. USHLN155]|uniref:hypothetical protein n=1 Tax=Oerskovia sp. USHLN155 TaxID=3081288 RepID=UPI003017230D